MLLELDELPLGLWHGLSMASMEHGSRCGGSGAKGSGSSRISSQREVSRSCCEVAVMSVMAGSDESMGAKQSQALGVDFKFGSTDEQASLTTPPMGP